MHLIRGLVNLRKFEQGCVVTIGNFDGVHLGHRAVITKLAKKGRELNLPVVVMLFEPQPLEYFCSERKPARLSRLREKVVFLQKLPIDSVLILRFDRALSVLSAADFVQKILLDGLNTKYLVVGDDFRFGYKRLGNYQLLQNLAAKDGFVVASMGSHSINGGRVSSTVIRNALAVGDLETAKSCLGRPFSMIGRVIHGNQNGRLIGFPTANIPVFRKNSPIHGVFAVTMSQFQNREWSGVANVGVRPTFGGSSVFILEVHLFEFELNLYGRLVEVHFHKKIRGEMRFRSVDELKKQIQLDVVSAKEILGYGTGLMGSFTA